MRVMLILSAKVKAGTAMNMKWISNKLSHTYANFNSLTLPRWLKENENKRCTLSVKLDDSNKQLFRPMNCPYIICVVEFSTQQFHP